MVVPASSLMRVVLIVLLAVSVAGCEVIGGIFKAGVWVGVISVVLVAVVAFWLVAKVRG